MIDGGRGRNRGDALKGIVTCLTGSWPRLLSGAAAFRPFEDGESVVFELLQSLQGLVDRDALFLELFRSGLIFFSKALVCVIRVGSAS